MEPEGDILLITLRRSKGPGILAAVLKCLADHNLNISSIYSQPPRGEEQQFFVVFQTDLTDAQFAAINERPNTHAERVGRERTLDATPSEVLVFSLPDTVGSLARCLQVFADATYDLTSIHATAVPAQASVAVEDLHQLTRSRLAELADKLGVVGATLKHPPESAPLPANQFFAQAAAAPEKLCIFRGPPGGGKSSGVQDLLKTLVRGDTGTDHVLLVAPQDGNVEDLRASLSPLIRTLFEAKLFCCIEPVTSATHYFAHPGSPYHPNGIPYRVVIVDEAQDLQLEPTGQNFLKKLLWWLNCDPRHKLILLGDDNQYMGKGRSGLLEAEELYTPLILRGHSSISLRCGPSVLRLLKQFGELPKYGDEHIDSIPRVEQESVGFSEMLCMVWKGDLVVTPKPLAVAMSIAAGRHLPVCLPLGNNSTQVLIHLLLAASASRNPYDHLYSALTGHELEFPALLAGLDWARWRTQPTVDQSAVLLHLAQHLVPLGAPLAITIGNVLHTKGLSANRVFVTDIDKLTNPNEKFVAFTRARFDVHVVEDDSSAWPLPKCVPPMGLLANAVDLTSFAALFDSVTQTFAMLAESVTGLRKRPSKKQN